MADDWQKEAMTMPRLTRWFAAGLLPAIVATVAAALWLGARHDLPPRAVVAVAPTAGEPVRAQEATVNQLDAAALTPDDLEPGFYIVDQSRTSKPPAAFRFLVRLSPDPRLGPDAEQVYLVLAADPADPDTVASDGVTALQTDSNLTDVTASDPVAAEWLAPGAIAYQFSGRGGVRSVVGDLYAWRQGPVIVSLTVITNTGDSEQVTALAARVAQRQRDKLAAALATPGP